MSCSVELSTKKFYNPGARFSNNKAYIFSSLLTLLYLLCSLGIVVIILNEEEECCIVAHY